MRSLARAALALAAAAALAAASQPALASEALLPGEAQAPYQRWSYPSQVPGGPLETGQSPARPAPGGFLTLPFFGAHYVTSVFDHCGPTYVPDGLVCRFDGRTHAAGGLGDGPTAGQDWLYYDGHDGLDYGLYYERVVAAADGVVSFAGWDRPGCPKCGFGQYVFVDHGNGITTRYAHLEAILVAKGQRVRRGEVLGISGNTGSSSGEHLHFGVYLTDRLVAIDPYGWSGDGPDPWQRDLGDLWLGGAPRFAAMARPEVAVQAVPDPDDPSRIRVAWSSPGGGSFDLAVVEDGQPARSWLERVGPGSASFAASGGHAYWFLATVHDQLGWSDGGSSDTVAVGGDSLLP
jgi:murein DD-endopeptidase MepM/ murein hydrolase activator NlpD